MDEIEVPDRPDVPGLRFRRFRGQADYPGMAAAIQAGLDEAGSLEVVSIDDMARYYAHLVNCDPERDILIVERDGTMVGYARVEWRDLVDGSRGFTSVCNLVPTNRRLGIGSAMLGWAEARLAATAASLPADRPMKMRTWTWDADQGAGVLLRSRGWTAEGRGYEMLRPTLDDIPDVALPDGFEVRAVVGEADERRVWDAAAEAFRDERGEEEWTRAGLGTRAGRPTSRPDAVGDRLRRGRRRGRRPREDRSRREHGPRRPPGLHRRRLDPGAVPPARPGPGAPRPVSHPAPRARDDERVPRRRRAQPQPGHEPVRGARVRDPLVRDRLDQAAADTRRRDGGHPMTTEIETHWIELEDAPAIPGLRVRRWRDAADYAAMAAAAAAAYDADAVPFMPTADNLRVQIEGEDGIDPAERPGAGRGGRRGRGVRRGLGRHAGRPPDVRGRRDRPAGVPAARDRAGPARGEPASSQPNGPSPKASMIGSSSRASSRTRRSAIERS